jgi:hypothetical protein
MRERFWYGGLYRRTPSGTPVANAWLALSMLADDEYGLLQDLQLDRWLFFILLCI